MITSQHPHKSVVATSCVSVMGWCVYNNHNPSALTFTLDCEIV